MLPDNATSCTEESTKKDYTFRPLKHRFDIRSGEHKPIQEKTETTQVFPKVSTKFITIRSHKFHIKIYPPKGATKLTKILKRATTIKYHFQGCVCVCV